MGRPQDSPGFKALKKQWDRILEETGFDDLEDEWGNLKQRASNAYRGADAVVRGAKLEFFTQVSQKVSHTQFPNKLEKYIMERFAEGVKQVQIRERLEQMGMPRCRFTVYRIIHRWLRRWGLR